MLLSHSHYRNPPYRDPTVSQSPPPHRESTPHLRDPSSSSSAANTARKRPRPGEGGGSNTGDSASDNGRTWSPASESRTSTTATTTKATPADGSSSPPTLRLDTADIIHGHQDLLVGESVGVADSPRSKVAERLRSLELESWRGGSPSYVQPRKRMRAAEDEDDDEDDDERKTDRNLDDDDASSNMTSTAPKRAQPKHKQHCGSPTAADRAAQTWKESEITGHDIDPTSPDDDGEGINGVGFKPTPAMEYVRRQKRRQQVSDWKAREAKDARQKRIERRRGASGSGSEKEGGVSTGVSWNLGGMGGLAEAPPAKRIVRFVGMD